MKLFEANIETVIIRYYLVIALTLIPFFLGIPIYALLAVPVFLSALLGVSFNYSVKRESDRQPKTILFTKLKRAFS